MKKEEIKEINRFRALFPSEVRVNVARSENGDFVARINTFKGLFTEGSNFSELIEMVNDAVKTYYEVPEKFIPYMPNYVPPLEAAQLLDVFPINNVKKNIVLPISTSEKVAR
ncbi:MAG: hypothetical protein A3B13_02670 [Candidatus Liptonbacteria bacterium RIFCSPLOWO2_01_FULL_45_15]|uniref:Uncharacterized protein n=1 Tax=Candidatus Liptonbacteria bacterium RIFCSPLOWO2_01_FULL_45_15 TaxID=1798649 RepID=A0A1G2CIE8_9BACT|nr:MAG: hypothetical protein A3B13_02670 [Candidatus Liptonbacteria bacterium RIFCSPLOWO2_01_FULL_45_15]